MTTMIVTILYLIIVIIVAFFAHRSGIKDPDLQEQEYDIGGKAVHWFLIMMSTFASATSAFLFVGVFSMAYMTGISAMWYAIIASTSGPLLLWIFGSRLRKFSDTLDAYTLVEYLNKRVGDKIGYVGAAGGLITFFFLFFYIGAQIRAAATQFQHFFGTQLIIGAVIMGALIVGYTFFAGFRGVAWTDTLQGLTMIGASIAIVVAGLYRLGGFTGLLSALEGQSANLVSITGAHPGVSLVFIITLVGWMGTSMAGMGNPHVAVRPIGMKEEKNMKIAGLFGAFSYAPTYALAVVSGLITRALLPDLTNPDMAFGVLTTELFPPILVGVMLGGLLAAIMSTGDSQLLTAAAEFVRNIYNKAKPDASQKQRVIVTRMIVLVLGVLSIIIGLLWEEVIFWFVLFAWGGLGAAFFPVMAISLFWKRLTKEGALVGILSGFGTVVIWKSISQGMILAQYSEITGQMYEAVPGIIISTTLIIIVSLVTEPPKDLIDDLDI